MEDQLRRLGLDYAIFDAVEALSPEFEMIRLSGSRVPAHIELGSLGDGFSLVRPVNVACGSTAYVLTSGGAAKLRRYMRRMTRQIDVTLDRYWESGLRIF